MKKVDGEIRFNKLLITSFCFLAIVLGALQAWETRHSMNPDGISYLDMGDAYLRGDWDMAVNAYWSPLYSWLLGLAMLIFKPSPYWEFSVVHLVNFLIYLCALGCFHFFLLQLIQYHKYRSVEPSGGGYEKFPEWALIVFGYSMFIWTSLNLITISAVTPDMCVAAFVFLASGILLRIRRGSISRSLYSSLGFVLGVSYLAKAIMFPVSFLYILLSGIIAGNTGKAVPRMITALVVFLLVAGPFIWILSDSKGRLTFGDSGRLNYAWYVNSVTQWVHWQGEPPGSGEPEHPTRKIFDEPGVYEFGTPIGGMYPPWYDPSYWNEGVRVYFDLSKQLKVTKKIAGEYIDLLFKLQPGLIIACCFLYYMSRRRRLCIKDIAGEYSMIVPAIAVMIMYSLVHMEYRFLGAFILILWMGLFSGVRLPVSDRSGVLLSSVSVLLVLVILGGTSDAPMRKAYRYMKSNVLNNAPNVSWQVAEILNEMGMRAGDKVASVGWAGSNYWARLARVRIVAEVRQEDKRSFLKADRSVKSQIYRAIAGTGAKLLVIYEPEGLERYDFMEKWERIGETPFHVYFLQ